MEAKQQDRPISFNTQCIQNLVRAQIAFIEDELVTTLGLVRSATLKAVLAVGQDLKPRAVTCHEAVLDKVVGRAARREGEEEVCRLCLQGNDVMMAKRQIITRTCRVECPQTLVASMPELNIFRHPAVLDRRVASPCKAENVFVFGVCWTLM